MILSILISSLFSRQTRCRSLAEFIDNQIEDLMLNDDIEVLIFPDNKEWKVGEKRNLLLEKSIGDYICFVDDDDWVSDDYIKLIVEGIKNNDVDCIGFKGMYNADNRDIKEFIHSIKYNKYYEDANYYYRPPNHLNPIKRDIAIKYKFPTINFGEDTDWAMQICNSGELKKEHYIDKVLYYYNFISNK
jgi:glycosyltransferase involved in cell wall biosynthesis